MQRLRPNCVTAYQWALLDDGDLVLDGALRNHVDGCERCQSEMQRRSAGMRAAERAPLPPRLAELAGQPRTGLEKPIAVLADDEEVVLRAMRLLLAPLCDTRVFTSAAEAVNAVRELKPSVVILDIRMPLHDGFWGFEQIRQFDKNVPIIFNSAYQDKHSVHDVQASFMPFGRTSKNGDVKELYTIVKRALQVSAEQAPR